MISTSLFTEVSSLICDQKGKIWVGAENRLFAWSIAEEKMALFSETDGAVPNEYFPEARLLSLKVTFIWEGLKDCFILTVNYHWKYESAIDNYQI